MDLFQPVRLLHTTASRAKDDPYRKVESAKERADIEKELKT